MLDQSSELDLKGVGTSDQRKIGNRDTIHITKAKADAIKNTRNYALNIKNQQQISEKLSNTRMTKG